jgi:hypothetical protein
MNTEHGEGVGNEMMESEWCGRSEKLHMQPTGRIQQLLPWPRISYNAPHDAEQITDMQKHE